MTPVRSKRKREIQDQDTESGRPNPAHTTTAPTKRIRNDERETPTNPVALAHARVLAQAGRHSALALSDLAFTPYPAKHRSLSDGSPSTESTDEPFVQHQESIAATKIQRDYRALSDSHGTVAVGAKLSARQWASVRARWPIEDEAKLLNAKDQDGKSWAEIGRHVLPHRGAKACSSYYNRITRLKQDRLGSASESLTESASQECGGSGVRTEGELQPQDLDKLKRAKKAARKKANAKSDDELKEQYAGFLSAREARMFTDLAAVYRSTPEGNAHHLFQYHGAEVEDFRNLAQAVQDWREARRFSNLLKTSPTMIRMCTLLSISLNDYNSTQERAIGKLRWDETGTAYFLNDEWQPHEQKQYVSQTPFQRHHSTGCFNEFLWRRHVDTKGPAVLPILPICALPSLDDSNANVATIPISKRQLRDAKERGDAGPLVLIFLPTEAVLTNTREVAACLDQSHTGGKCEMKSSNVYWTFAPGNAYDQWSYGKTVVLDENFNNAILERLADTYDSAERGEDIAVILEQFSDVRSRLYPASRPK